MIVDAAGFIKERVGLFNDFSIDTDEGNAANVKTGAQGYIDGIQSEGHQSS